MELHQLEYFLAVAETGSFSRAAERCSVAQPSLSQQIIKLEQELGAPLFDRLGRGAVLTAAGQALLPRARRIRGEVQAVRRGLSQDVAEGRGRLAAGFIPTIAPFLLPGAIRQFARAFPLAELAVVEDLTDHLLNDLVNGKLDVAIMSALLSNRLVEVEELVSEPLLVAAACGQAGFARQAIPVAELEEHPFVSLSEIHCLGEQVQAFCTQRALSLEVVCEASQLSTLRACVALGLGVSLVPYILAASDTSGEVCYRPVSGAEPRRKIVAAARRGRAPSLLARNFSDIVRLEAQRLLACPLPAVSPAG